MSLANVQQRLKNGGFYSGQVDGVWGTLTEVALANLMDRVGLAKIDAAPIVPAHPQYTIQSFIQHFIRTYEGGLSMDPKDTGNWYRGVLCGSKYGVTAGALADYRNNKEITPADISTLTEGEAVQIGISLYYDRPDFDLLPWNQVTASWMDMGWGAGPGQAIKLMQRMIGVGDDGKIGRFTVQAFEDYILNHGLEQAAISWCDVRYAFYDQIIKVRPANAKYRNGWRNRSAGFLPETDFWNQWSA